jgi:hypothetical protein
MSPERNESSPAEEKRRPDPSSTLQGWPGYRTRAGRSGLDPIDNRTEAGHMAGLVLRDLLTGTLVTRNSFSLFVFGILGVLFLAPLGLALYSAFQGGGFPFSGWLVTGILGLAGGILLVNLFRNLLRPFQ